MKYRSIRTGLIAATLILSCSLVSCGLEEINAGGGSTFQSENTEDTRADEITGTEDETAGSRVTVHVAGAVMHPGVYELEAGSRLADAVTMAGGFIEDAAKDYCNLAAELEDGRQYTIPKESELEKAGGENAVLDAGDGKIDINRAGVSELMKLTGIGESRARALIAYREEHGDYLKTEDIMKVSGIGEGLYEKIKDEIVIR